MASCCIYEALGLKWSGEFSEAIGKEDVLLGTFSRKEVLEIGGLIVSWWFPSSITITECLLPFFGIFSPFSSFFWFFPLYLCESGQKIWCRSQNYKPISSDFIREVKAAGEAKRPLLSRSASLSKFRLGQTSHSSSFIYYSIALLSFSPFLSLFYLLLITALFRWITVKYF